MRSPLLLALFCGARALTLYKFSYPFPAGPLCLGMHLDPKGFFPCAGGASNSCPLEMLSCSDPRTLFDVTGGVLCSTYEGPDGGACVDVDCDSYSPGGVAKVIAGPASWFASISFSNASAGQLVYTARNGMVRCLNAGQATPTPPCFVGEEYLSNQTSIDYCSVASTQGWQMLPA